MPELNSVHPRLHKRQVLTKPTRRGFANDDLAGLADVEKRVPLRGYDPVFLARRERIALGMRKAGVPEQ